MGMLQRNEGDMIVTFSVLNVDRLEVMEPSLTIMEEGSRMFVRSSDSLKLNTTELFAIFYSDAWYLLVCLILALISADMMLHSISGCSFREDGISSFEALGKLVLESGASVVLPIMARGSFIREYYQHFKAGKMLFLTIILLGVAIFACVRAGILSKLAVKKSRFEITSFDDVLGSDYQIGTMGGGSSQKFYEKAPKGTLQKRIWNEKMKPKYDSVMMTASLGLKAVSERESFAYTIYNSIGVTNSLHPCGITGVGPIFNLKSTVFAFRKGSALVEIFNHYLMRMKENGLLDKIIGSFIDKSHSKPDCDWALDNSLGLEPLFGLFGMLCLGIVSSLSLFSLEFIKGIVFGKRIVKVPSMLRPKTTHASFISILHSVEEDLSFQQKLILMQKLKAAIETK